LSGRLLCRFHESAHCPAQSKEGATVNLNDDFKRGVWVTLGVVAALYVVGLATGVLRKIV
jgi:hypothetical protein